MSPNTFHEWLKVAAQRQSDAEAVAEKQPTSVGSIYLAGYAIECSLKALLNKKGIPFPKHGSEGHNLVGLWEASTFRLSDLNDPTGSKAFFFHDWETALRYETALPTQPGLDLEELMQGAKQLTGYIQTNIRRDRRRR